MHGKLHARKGAWLHMDDQAGGIYLAPMIAAYDSSLKWDYYAIILLYTHS